VKHWHWILLPLSPLGIVAGFVAGILRGRDRKIAFYCDGEPVTFGQARRWGATTKGGGAWWEPKTKN
jgi:hypothetical protein